jgi:hypothetical protein
MKKIIILLSILASFNAFSQCDEYLMNTTTLVAQKISTEEKKIINKQVLFYVNYNCSPRIKMVIVGETSEIFTPFGDMTEGRTKNGTHYIYQRYLDETNQEIKIQIFKQISMIRIWYKDSCMEFYQE